MKTRKKTFKLNGSRIFKELVKPRNLVTRKWKLIKGVKLDAEKVDEKYRSENNIHYVIE